MRKTDTALLTVIFPENLKYWKDFVDSLNKQDSDFGLVVVLDGVLENEIKYLPDNLIVKFITSSMNPFQNRIRGIKFCKELGFYKVIFQDSDDLLSENRVRVVSKALDECPIVCNDLSLINESGEILQKRIWSERIKNGAYITKEKLSDKNMVGFGNTGIRTDIELPVIDLDLDLTAPDWFFFSILSFTNNVVFTSEAQTLYRQHPNNTVGLKELSVERLSQCLDVKIEHYNAMSSFDEIDIKFRTENPDTKVNYWLMCVELNNRKERDVFLKETNEKGIMTRPIWQLMYKLPMYEYCYRDKQKNAEFLEDRIVNIPSSVRL